MSLSPDMSSRAMRSFRVATRSFVQLGMYGTLPLLPWAVLAVLDFIPSDPGDNAMIYTKFLVLVAGGVYEVILSILMLAFALRERRRWAWACVAACGVSFVLLAVMYWMLRGGLP